MSYSLSMYYLMFRNVYFRRPANVIFLSAPTTYNVPLNKLEGNTGETVAAKYPIRIARLVQVNIPDALIGVFFVFRCYQAPSLVIEWIYSEIPGYRCLPPQQH